VSTISNGDLGTTFETAVCSMFEAEDVSDQGGEFRHVDAILPDGTRLSIKVARYRIDDGSRRGRYWIPIEEIEACDRHCFGVYRGDGDVQPVSRCYSAEIVERRCPKFVDSPRSDVSRVSRPPWSRFINPSLLTDGGQTA